MTMRIDDQSATVRVRRVSINPVAFVHVLRADTRYSVRHDGLPDDARIHAAAIDESTGDVVLFVESDAFDPVEYGEKPPLHEITIHRWGENE